LAEKLLGKLDDGPISELNDMTSGSYPVTAAHASDRGGKTRENPVYWNTGLL